MSDLVFISYSNADKKVADAICAELERAGIRCWIAPRDITPGRMWGEAIMDGIDSSRVMILVHSRHANRSPQVIREIERAVDRRLILLPVRLQDIKLKGALEFYLSSSQWLDAFPGPIDAYLASLPRLVQNLLAEAIDTYEHTAERTAERTAEQTAEQTAAQPIVPSLPASSPPVPVERPPDDALPTVATSPRGRASRRRVVSLAAALGTVILVGAWGLTQMNRDKNAPTLPANAPTNSGIDTSRDSVPDTAKVAKDSVVPKLRIVSTAATYRVDDRFSLRVETNGAGPLRWRTGDKTIISLSRGDSVFRAIAVGSAYLYAENETLRDSVRIKVISKPQASVASASQSPPAPVSGSKPQAGADTGKENPGSRVVPDRTPTRETIPPALTDSMARSKASECMTAIEEQNATWLRAHYGAPLTVDDAANLKALESIFKKRGYRASILERAKYAGTTVTFLMRLDYAGGFGPQLSVNVPFEVRMANGQPQGELESCRVRGALRSP